MKRSAPITVAILSFSASIALSLIAAAQTTAQQVTPPAAATKPVPPVHRQEDRGEHLFNANCYRCHQAPETLNPRISGTVVRHMRVRANLSAADEREILRFLNP